LCCPLVLKVTVRWTEGKGRAKESEICKVLGNRKGKGMRSGLFVVVQSRKKLSRIFAVLLLNFTISTGKGSNRVDVLHKITEYLF
jgi:hypothetical protein